MKVIGSLEVGTKDFGPLFKALKTGLQQPLNGMGTAFSSSLFGLGGSLVLGFLDIQAGQKQAMREERRLSADARAEVALLNRQMTNLRRQLEEISRTLEVAEADNQAKEAELKELGKRLNIALARRVNKREQYRSEFSGGYGRFSVIAPMCVLKATASCFRRNFYLIPGPQGWGNKARPTRKGRPRCFESWESEFRKISTGS